MNNQIRLTARNQFNEFLKDFIYFSVLNISKLENSFAVYPSLITSWKFKLYRPIYFCNHRDVEEKMWKTKIISPKWILCFSLWSKITITMFQIVFYFLFAELLLSIQIQLLYFTFSYFDCINKFNSKFVHNEADTEGS